MKSWFKTVNIGKSICKHEIFCNGEKKLIANHAAIELQQQSTQLYQAIRRE